MILRRHQLLSDKHIPKIYLRASEYQRRELVRGLFDGNGYFQSGGSDEITLTRRSLVDGVIELLHSLGFQVRVTESRTMLYGRDTGPRWRISARFDECPYTLSRYREAWKPRGTQSSRHTQRTITGIRRIEDRPTQCIEVDSPSHVFLAGDSMVPTRNSTIAALAVVWFAVTRERAGIEWKVLATATAWRHLAIYLWPEIHKWVRRVRFDELGMRPPGRHELLDLRMKLRHGAASAVASDDPVNIEGGHADSLLYVFDEAKGIPAATWDAVEGALAGGRRDGGLPEAFAFAISTPGDPSGRFYDIHSRKPGLADWHPMHVRLREAVKAGRIDDTWVQQRKHQWGEESALYKNRVLGEFHAADEDSVIPLAWVEAAVMRWHEWDESGRPPVHGSRVLGVDVARGGQDSTAIAARTGPCVSQVSRHQYADTMTTAAHVSAQAHAHVTAVVDSLGVGAGVVDRLKELKCSAQPYTGSAKTLMRDASGEFGFANTRSGAYWNLRELLDPARDSHVMLPPDDELLADVTTPRWSVTSGAPPRIKVEVKEEVNKRLGRSPDAGDAVVMAFWADRQRGQFRLLLPSEHARDSSPAPAAPSRPPGVDERIRSSSASRRRLSPLA